MFLRKVLWSFDVDAFVTIASLCIRWMIGRYSLLGVVGLRTDNCGEMA